MLSQSERKSKKGGVRSIKYLEEMCLKTILQVCFRESIALTRPVSVKAEARILRKMKTGKLPGELEKNKDGSNRTQNSSACHDLHLFTSYQIALSKLNSQIFMILLMCTVTAVFDIQTDIRRCSEKSAVMKYNLCLK